MTEIQNQPPMGDPRWIKTGTDWELSYITDAGTLVIPTPAATDFNEKSRIIRDAAVAHGFDMKRFVGIKHWGSVIAVHFK